MTPENTFPSLFCSDLAKKKSLNRKIDLLVILPYNASFCTPIQWHITQQAYLLRLEQIDWWMHIHLLKADFVPRVNNMGMTTILSHSSEVLQEEH